MSACFSGNVSYCMAKELLAVRLVLDAPPEKVAAALDKALGGGGLTNGVLWVSLGEPFLWWWIEIVNSGVILASIFCETLLALAAFGMQDSCFLLVGTVAWRSWLPTEGLRAQLVCAFHHAALNQTCSFQPNGSWGSNSESQHSLCHAKPLLLNRCLTITALSRPPCSVCWDTPAWCLCGWGGKFFIMNNSYVRVKDFMGLLYDAGRLAKARSHPFGVAGIHTARPSDEDFSGHWEPTSMSYYSLHVFLWATCNRIRVATLVLLMPFLRLTTNMCRFFLGKTVHFLPKLSGMVQSAFVQRAGMTHFFKGG